MLSQTLIVPVLPFVVVNGARDTPSSLDQSSRARHNLFLSHECSPFLPFASPFLPGIETQPVLQPGVGSSNNPETVTFQF